eukprot:2227884-Prorocentrum_lima.AAC.1
MQGSAAAGWAEVDNRRLQAEDELSIEESEGPQDAKPAVVVVRPGDEKLDDERAEAEYGRRERERLT